MLPEIKGETMEQVTRVDRTLLTSAQRAEYDAWQALFGDETFNRFVANLGEEAARLQSDYNTAIGEQHLGRIQGGLQVLRAIFNYNLRIETEFLALTGQLNPEDQVTNDPAQPGDWDA